LNKQGSDVSVIERAALRLESLQRTGIDVPWRQDAVAGAASAEAARAQPLAAPLQAVTAQPVAVPLAAVPVPVAAAVPTLHNVAPSVPHIPAAVRTDVFSSVFAAQKTRQTINKARLNALGYLVAGEDNRSRLAEEMRVVKRPLLHNAADPAVRRGNVIMITSSVAGEGKTFFSINLAMSMATELNRQVVLVEADSARPAVMERLGLNSAQPGLMDALANPAMHVNDVVVPTNIEQLVVIPSGRLLAHTTELVASERMVSFLDALALQWPNRIVLLDAPPLLQTTDAREMAPHVGQVVLVVESGRTKQAQVKQSMAMLERCPVVMSMLNRLPLGKGTAEYGYYAY
jgi:protein-tyrosine kinase